MLLITLEGNLYTCWGAQVPPVYSDKSARLHIQIPTGFVTIATLESSHLKGGFPKLIAMRDKINDIRMEEVKNGVEMILDLRKTEFNDSQGE